MQSTVILQGKYLDQAHSQLEAQEGKKNKPKNSKLVGDRWPRLLTGDAFYEKVVEHQKMQRELADAKETWKEQQEEKSKALAEWKVKDDERKKRNEEKRVVWKAAVVGWEVEHDRAKLAKKRPQWKKPTLGKMEAAASRPSTPSLEDIEEEAEENEEDEDDDNDDD